jgi:hypothetical protein
MGSFAGFRPWYWGGVPLLALAAWITALRVDFFADDLWLLNAARNSGLTLQHIGNDWSFYRPVGMLLTWELGWQLWGFNPLPYHLTGLLVHACASLALALWLAEVTGREVPGWLGGAIFAVLPLHIEVLAWVAAQWDAWAALFGLLSIWLFTRCWKGMVHQGKADRQLYFAALLLYLLGLFSKESLITFLPLFALSAWAATPRAQSGQYKRLALALVPFCVAFLLYLGVRFAVLGGLGGYNDVRTDYASFFWDSLISAAHLLVSPLNAATLGPVLPQVVGVLASLAILAGLVLYGRHHRRLLALCAGWLLLTLLPVANLGLSAATLEGNRYLYLPAAGYCAGVAALIYSAVLSVGRGRTRKLLLAALGLACLASIAVCWLHLRPWHTISVEVRDYNDELVSMIPPQPRPSGMVWYLDNPPHFQEGFDVLSLGFGYRRIFIANGDAPATQVVDTTDEQPIAQTPADAFLLKFQFNKRAVRYDIDFATGVTEDTAPPATGQQATDSMLWDFKSCHPPDVQSWQPVDTEVDCQAGRGLVLHPSTADSHLIGPDLEFAQGESGTRFVRIRADVLYPKAPDDAKWLSQWYWRGEGTDWSEERLYSAPVKTDGLPHEYWTFIPLHGDASTVTKLRFDPLNAAAPVEVRWIEADLVK